MKCDKEELFSSSMFEDKHEQTEATHGGFRKRADHTQVSGHSPRLTANPSPNLSSSSVIIIICHHCLPLHLISHSFHPLHHD